jgi:hypothetical protein
MFKELGSLPRQRAVVLVLMRLEDDTVRVNIIARKLNESENDTLRTPLSVTGTAVPPEFPSLICCHSVTPVLWVSALLWARE